MDVLSFYLSAFTLQLDSNVSYSNPMYFHTFSEETFAGTSDMVDMLDNKIVIVSISLDDLNEIKRKRIADSIDATWLTLTSDGLAVNNLQPVMPLMKIGFACKLQLRITPDTTAQELENYDVSLDEGSLTLFFTETVDITTSQLSLTHSSTNLTLSHNSTPNLTCTLSLNSSLISLISGIISLISSLISCNEAKFCASYLQILV